MSRVSLARRAITVTAGTMVLMGAMLVPFASVAAAATTCPAPEGTECFLRISAPASVQTNTNVVLRVLITSDGTNVASSDPCATGATVTIAVSGPPENFNTYNATSNRGVATFVLNFATAGTWTVNADATKTGSSCFYVSAPTKTIEAVDSSTPLAPCPPDVSCVQASSGTGTGATIIAGSGNITPAPEFVPPPDGVWFGTEAQMPLPGGGGGLAATSTSTTTVDPFGCHDGGPPDTASGVLGFHLDTSTSKVKFVVYSFDPTVYTKSINKYDICWQQDTLFKPKGGGPQVFRGYLPNCSFWDDRWERWEREDNSARRAGPPCILFRFATRSAKYIVVIAPIDSFGNDPFGYGH